VYNTAHSIDAAVVGIVDRDEPAGLVHYIDASAANTIFASGAALVTSTPNASQGPDDNMWHLRTGVGNGSNVLSSNETGSENAPLLKTTLEGLSDGEYDIFAYFWSDNDEDWRLMAGLDQNNLLDFRRIGAQHADEDQFTAIEVVSANSNDLLLYRAYLGRTEVTDGAAIDVFVDDYSTNNSQFRTWFDGLGYSLVSESALLPGDYNGNGVVDAADYVVWRNHLNTSIALPNEGATPGTVTQEDYDLWLVNFGESSAHNSAVPEPSSIIGVVVVALASMAGLRRSAGLR
jgi:hypothetical protein